MEKYFNNLLPIGTVNVLTSIFTGHKIVYWNLKNKWGRAQNSEGKNDCFFIPEALIAILLKYPKLIRFGVFFSEANNV